MDFPITPQSARDLIELLEEFPDAEPCLATVDDLLELVAGMEYEYCVSRWVENEYRLADKWYPTIEDLNNHENTTADDKIVCRLVTKETPINQH